jgi:uncharacterized membrane protein
MNNGRVFGIAMLIIGVVLLVYGVNATHSVSSEFSRLFQGAPSEKSVWLIMAGGLLAGLGLVQSLKGRPVS